MLDKFLVERWIQAARCQALSGARLKRVTYPPAVRQLLVPCQPRGWPRQLANIEIPFFSHPYNLLIPISVYYIGADPSSLFPTQQLTMESSEDKQWVTLISR